MFRRSIPIALMVSVTLAGCQGRSAATSDNGSPSATSTASSAIIAAAEPFEGLTEQAATAPWAQVDGLLSTARAAVGAIRSRLPASSSARVETQLNEIAAARSSQDRLGVALASVEGYRTIVEAQNRATAKPPIPVSLLDYAGFRYDALASARSVDWNAMAQSVAFARQQWSILKPRIKSPAMTGVVESALDGMSAAVKTRNVAFARSAAATELSLVDLLEQQPAGS
jgi:hypothetical protein